MAADYTATRQIDGGEAMSTMAARYPHLGTVGQAQPIVGDSGRTQWLLTTASRRFVLRASPPGTDVQRAKFTATVQQHAAASGLAPPVVPDAHGRLVTHDAGRTFVLTGYAEGSCDLPRFPDARQCRELGDLLGRMHRCLQSAPRIPNAAGQPLQAGPVAGLVAALAAHRRPDCAHPDARQALLAKLRLARALTPDQLERPSTRPRQLVHGDFHPGNLVVADGRAHAVIDFERARLAPPGYELVRALLYCVNPAGPPVVSEPRVAAFLTGYLNVFPLHEEALGTMVDLYRTVQVLDPHGLDTCADAESWRLRFGHARFALLRWLDLRGTWLTDLATRARTTDRRRHGAVTEATMPEEAALLRGVARTTRDDSHRMGFVSGPVGLLIQAGSSWPIDTLTDTFVPYLDPTRPELLPRVPRTEEIRVVVDPALTALLPAGLTARQGAAVMVRQLVSPDAGPPKGFVLWERQSPSISYVVLPDEDRLSAKLLFRAARAVAARILLAAGWLPLHAACFVTAAGAVLLTGPRGSGKTTALLRMLGTGTAALTANNRVFLGGRPTAPVVRALPISVAIRPRTLDLLPELRPLTETAAHPYWEMDEAPTGGQEPRLLVPPRTLAQTFGAGIVPLAPLQAVVDVAHGPGNRPTRCSLLSVDERITVLRAACRPDWFRDEPHERLRFSPITTLTETTMERRFRRWAPVISGARFERRDATTAALVKCVERVLA